MSKILSLIIPSCNMEGYLPQCLQSLIVPSISDIEVLVINDGSKDHTSEIAHEFEARYPGSIRAIDKENGHYGSCINRGLAEARGKYIKVLDADDSFESGEFEKFIAFLKATDADIVFSDYCIVDESGAITAEKRFPDICAGRILTFKDAFSLFAHVNMAMHAVTYRTALLRAIDYHQTEGVAYTDQEWIFAPVLNVRTVAQFPHIVYRYLVGRQGQSVDSSVITKAMSLQLKHFDKRLDDFAKVADGLTEEQRRYAFVRMRYSMVNTFKCILLGKTTAHYAPELVLIDSKLHKVFPELYLALETERLRPQIPFRYIRYWRKRYPRGRKTPLISLLKSFINLGY